MIGHFRGTVGAILRVWTPPFLRTEEAALSAWAHTPAAHARVVEVQWQGEDEALVVIEVAGDPAYNRDLVTCARSGDGLWTWTGSTGAGTF